jgi:hypothetical protein
MSNAKLFKALRENFLKAVAEKNSWGKNEISATFDRVSAETMADHIDASEVRSAPKQSRVVEEEEEEVVTPVKKKITAKPVHAPRTNKDVPWD